jgi:hypothetical protein
LCDFFSLLLSFYYFNNNNPLILLLYKGICSAFGYIPFKITSLLSYVTIQVKRNLPLPSENWMEQTVEDILNRKKGMQTLMA